MNLDFEKNNGLIPAIIQDAITGKVLMLGYMNEEAFKKTKVEKRVTFYSRSKKRLWTKGEESGNFLEVISIATDCDEDTLLVKVKPLGPVCHKGFDTCWAETNKENELVFLQQLEQTISDRKKNTNTTSYTSDLFSKGINKIAQKVGEEAIELVIESKDENQDLFLGEAADLLFHFLILLQAKGNSLKQVVKVLEERKKTR